MHSSHDCSHNPSTPSVHQTLEELDFSRGLLGAASDGDYDKVESLLRKGHDPNQVDAYGYSALTKGGSTALHRASYHGHLQCVCLLLNSGADSTLADSDGKTALHKAAENGHQEVCKILLKKTPCLLEAKDIHGKTALECALPKHPHMSEVLR